MIKTHCYGEIKEWANRDEAIKFFSEAIECSEGSEQSRYSSILVQLLEGCEECFDD